MSEWIDVSRPMDQRLVMWPGRDRPRHSWERQIAAGDHCNASLWQLSAHSGTHMDAPLHFIAGGKPIDEVSPDVFLGPCQVVDICGLEKPILDDAAAWPYVGAKRLVVRSPHSLAPLDGSYEPHEALMTETAASALVAAGLVLVGTDRLTVDDSGGKANRLHHIFLGAGCVIVEGLYMPHIASGAYYLSATPLRFTGLEASPIRALVRQES